MNPASSQQTLPPWLKIALGGSVVVFLLFIILGFTAITVLRTDPARLGFVLEAVASKMLNRELKIGQLVEADLDWDIYLLAQDVSLANPDWAETPDFFRVERFLIRINLPSIWRDGPIIIDKLEMTNATLVLLAPDDNPPNWDFQLIEDAGEIVRSSEEEQDGEDEAVFPVLIRDGSVINGEITYRDPVRDMLVKIENLNILEPREDGLIAIDLTGVFNKIPLDVTGHIGPTSALLTQRNVDLDLRVNWGQLTVKGHGHIENVADLSGLSLDLIITSPHSLPLLDAFGIKGGRDGPVYFEAQVSDAQPGVLVDLQGTFNHFNLALSGKLSRPLAFDGLDVTFTLGGASLAEDANVLGLPGLPAIPYEVSANIYRNGSMLGVRKGTITAGNGKIALEGFLPEFPGIDGWRLKVEGSNINLALIGPLIGAEGLPQNPYHIEAELDSTGGIESIHLRINNPQSSVTLDGIVGEAPDYLGSSLHFNLSSTSLASSVLWLGIQDLPSLAFTLDGEISISDTGWHLDSAKFSTPDLQLALSGEIDKLFEPTRVVADIALNSPDLSAALKIYGWDLEPLPAFPLAITGRIMGSPDNLAIEQVTIRSGESRMVVSGVLGDITSLAGLNLDVSLETLDIFQFIPVMGDDLQPLMPLEASGKVKMSSGRILFEEFGGQMGATQIMLTAMINPSGQYDSSHVTIDAKSADLGKVLAPWIDYEIKSTPFHVTLDAIYQSGAVRVERLDAEVGDNRLTAQINFDNPEDINSANGKIQLTGPSSDKLFQILGIDPPLTDANYTLTVDIRNSSDFLHLDPISLTWGRSDLGGSASIQFGDKPIVNAELHSQFLDLSFLLPNMQKLEQDEATRMSEGDTFVESLLFEELTTKELADRVIPEEPLNFSWIKNLQASFIVQLDEIHLREGTTTSAIIDVSIADDLLSSRQLEWDGEYFAGNMQVNIRALESTNTIDVYFDIQRIPLLLFMGGEPDFQPDSFYRGRITATGNNLREMAKSANGALIFKGSGGRLDNKGLNLILGDVLEEIISRLNPYVETDPHTRLVCHAGAMTIKDGELLVAPGMVLRGDKMDIVTGGKINLHNEKLNLGFDTRSRRGIGISASKAITPYFKIGGTLANPRLVLNVKGATVSGSAAVATAGLSILAQGLWDRWIATAKNPCDRLIEVASKQKNKVYESLLVAPTQQ